MAEAIEIWPLHVIEEALRDDADGILPQAIPERGTARADGAASNRYVGVSGGAAGDYRQRGAGAGVGRDHQCAGRGVVGGAAGVRRGDGVAGVTLSADYAD